MTLFDDAKKSGLARDTKFVRLNTGMPTIIQLLEHDSVVKYQHWLTSSDSRRVSVRCTGFLTCPICMRNATYGNDRENPKVIPSQRRYDVNVVELTMVKRSLNTGEVFVATKDATGRFIYPERDSAGNSLTDIVPAPWNSVKILEGGPRLFKKIQTMVELEVDGNGEPVDPTTYPIQVVRVGDGRDTDYLVSALRGNKLTVNPKDYAEQIIDLHAVEGFNRDEIEALMAGTQLKDILAARRATEKDAFDDLFDVDADS